MTVMGTTSSIVDDENDDNNNDIEETDREYLRKFSKAPPVPKEWAERERCRAT